MDRDEQFAILFGQWKAGKQQGTPPTIGVLCREHPDLKEEFRSRLPEFIFIDAVFNDDASDMSAAGVALQYQVKGYDSLSFHREGGLSVVLTAEDEKLNRVVALKWMKDKVALDPASKQQFLQEAKITAMLDHPGVIPIHARGQDEDGRDFYAMRFVNGETLQEAIDRFHGQRINAAVSPFEHNLEFHRLIGALISVCETMAYAHSLEVIHCDLKPANIMLGTFGETLVLDWGLAKRLNAPDDARAEEAKSSKDKAGTTKGTPAFMSPEQAFDLSRAAQASDIYSLGATLYSVLTGKPPYAGETAEEIVAKVKSEKVVLPSPREVLASVPHALNAICQKAMSREPRARYDSPRELAHDLKLWLADEPVEVFRDPWTTRLRRWMRRHRTLTTAAAAALFVALFTISGAAGLLREKNEQLHAANYNLTTHLYARDIALADREWRDGRVDESERYLDDAPVERRNFEWNYQKRRCHPGRLIVHFDSPLEAAAMSADGKEIYIVDQSGMVKQLDATSGKVLREFSGHEKLMKRARFEFGGGSGWAGLRDSRSPVAVFSHDGTRVALLGENQEIRVWDVAQARLLRDFEHLKGKVCALALDGTGNRLAVATSEEKNQRTTVYDVAGGSKVKSASHVGCPRTLALSGDGNRVLALLAYVNTTSQTSGTQLTILHLDTNADTTELPQPLSDRDYFESIMAFTETGDFVAIGSTEGTVFLWNVAEKKLNRLGGHTKAVTSVDFSRDGNWLATGSSDGIVRLWDVRSNTEVATIRGVGTDSLTFSPDGRQLLCAGYDTVSIHEVIPPEPFGFSAVSIHPAENLVAVARSDQSTVVYNAQSRAEIRKLTGGERCATFSPDGKWLATVAERSVVIRNTQNWDAVRLAGHSADIYKVAFSPDSRLLCSASDDKSLRIWELGTSTPLQTFRGHTDAVRSAAFSPDGKRVASISRDGSARIWDVDSGKVMQTFPLAYGLWGADVAFSPDGRFLATAARSLTGRDIDSPGELKIWDAQTGKEQFTMKGHRGAVRALAYSPDGLRLVSVGQDRTVRIWNTQSGQEMMTLTGHSEPVVSVAWSFDGTRIITGSEGLHTVPNEIKPRYSGEFLIWDGRPLSAN